MTLSEMRTGDFGGFQEGYLETGDNLAGWEAIINNNNGDPYNGDITMEGVQIGQNDPDAAPDAAPDGFGRSITPDNQGGWA